MSQTQPVPIFEVLKESNGAIYKSIKVFPILRRHSHLENVMLPEDERTESISN